MSVREIERVVSSQLVETGTGIQKKVRCDVPEPDYELEDVESTFVQYIRQGNTFSPAGKVVLASKLQRFAYRPVMTMSGVVFEKVKPRTDELLTFPSSAMHKVIEEIDKFWRLKDNFTKLGFLHNRGILVYGPPGTGKSCMMQQVAEQMVNQGDVIFFAKSLSPVEAGLRAFREIEPDREVVVVLEDLDEYLQYSERDLLQLLDGDNSVDNVLYLGSTNYVKKFPPRLLRPGRFDKCIYLGPPPLEGRLVYLQHKLKTLEEDDEIKRIAEQTDGLSFGHLRELVIAAYAFEEPINEVIKRLKKSDPTLSESKDPRVAGVVDRLFGEKGDPELQKKYIKKVGEKEKPWCIVSKNTGRKIACYKTKAAAKADWSKTMKRIHTHK